MSNKRQYRDRIGSGKVFTIQKLHAGRRVDIVAVDSGDVFLGVPLKNLICVFVPKKRNEK